MNSSSHPSSSSRRCSASTARGMALKVFSFRSACMLYSAVCLTSVSVPADASRLRCGTDLLADLIFVCGDRGIYLGKHNWSGYGPRPRGKAGIVDHCCKPGGCDLQHLETYCASPMAHVPPRDRPQQQTTTAAAGPPGSSSSTPPPTTTTTTPQQLAVTQQQQFESVFRKRLLQQLGTPDSPERQTYRRTTTQDDNPPQRRANHRGGSRRRTRGTQEPPSHRDGPLSTTSPPPPSPLPGTTTTTTTTTPPS